MDIVIAFATQTTQAIKVIPLTIQGVLPQTNIGTLGVLPQISIGRGVLVLNLSVRFYLLGSIRLGWGANAHFGEKLNSEIKVPLKRHQRVL